MKNLWTCVLILLAFPTFLSAQDADAKSYRPFELAWNPISYMRQDGANLKGASFSLGYRRSQRLGYVLDLSIHQTSDANPVPYTAYRFVPRLYFAPRGKFTPFAEVLGGGAFVGTKLTVVGNTATVTDKSHSGVSLAAGGGLDMKFRPWFSWRVFQVDYSLIRAGGDTLNGVRIHTGGIFQFPSGN